MLDAMSTDEDCLKLLLQQALAQEDVNLTVEEKANMAKLCEECSGMLSGLQAWTPSEEQQGQPVAEGGLDSQILDVYQQVCAAGDRVRKLRQEVPGELSAALHQELVSFRPALLVQGDAAPELSEGPRQDGLQAGTGGSPAEEEAPACDLESWRQLNDLSGKVPTLMARLDQTLQRLTRIVDITEADQSRPSPRTVEKVLLNRGVADDVSGDDDREFGAVHTRKRLAYDLGA